MKRGANKRVGVMRTKLCGLNSQVSTARAFSLESKASRLTSEVSKASRLTSAVWEPFRFPLRLTKRGRLVMPKVRRDALLTVGKPSRLALWGYAPVEEGKARRLTYYGRVPHGR